jgi:hypothetical protein
MSSLAFVEVKDGAISVMWKPEVSGDFEKDCAKGREYAQEYAGYLQSPDASPGSLNQIVKAMPRHKMGGVEIGFFQALAGKLM